MIQIRPVSDLRNKFPEIERLVNQGQPVYLTKNGYGSMVVLSLELYSALVDGAHEPKPLQEQSTNKTKPCITLDDENKELIIHTGTQGSIPYDAIAKVSVLNEDIKFKGKGIPFSHQVLGGTTFVSMLGEPSLVVGLKITLKDGTIKAAYISDRKTTINTDIYKEDTKEAQKWKKAIDLRIL